MGFGAAGRLLEEISNFAAVPRDQMSFGAAGGLLEEVSNFAARSLHLLLWDALSWLLALP